jgi:hypothetical protein
MSAEKQPWVRLDDEELRGIGLRTTRFSLFLAE